MANADLRDHIKMLPDNLSAQQEFLGMRAAHEAGLGISSNQRPRAKS